MYVEYITLYLPEYISPINEYVDASLITTFAPALAMKYLSPLCIRGFLLVMSCLILEVTSISISNANNNNNLAMKYGVEYR